MQDDIDSLRRFLDGHAKLAVLTGAGCSTASGIPEYRDDAGSWKHARPVRYGDFVAQDAVRQRYWARSYVGWKRMSAAMPNDAHRALAHLGADGRLAGLVTQNVDNLHRRAGSRPVIDLHGTLENVICLGCGGKSPRAGYQAKLEAANPGWTATAEGIRPDGDAELADAASREFRVPGCERCGGVLKPDVVFFGESVPRERVAEASAWVDAADALLVVGSSLMVFSGFRFVRQAAEAGKPVAILNRGRTRGDELATLKLAVDCSAALAAVAGGEPARAARP